MAGGVEPAGRGVGGDRSSWPFRVDDFCRERLDAVCVGITRLRLISYWGLCRHRWVLDLVKRLRAMTRLRRLRFGRLGDYCRVGSIRKGRWERVAEVVISRDIQLMA